MTISSEFLPPLFVERLAQIFPEALLPEILRSFEQTRPVALRVNTLKASVATVQELFAQHGVSLQGVPWAPEAFTVDPLKWNPADRAPQWFQDCAGQGRVYQQALSSQLPVVVLDPQSGQAVLDLCAAPGSKTTQIAARCQGDGRLVAVERVRNRFYKLKSVLNVLGAEEVAVHCGDGRRYGRDGEGFDRILVDAPCSAEGRFSIANPKSWAYWSKRKIVEMRQKQRGLLWHALRLLNPGGRLVYATCTFAPEENEGVVDWVLRKQARLQENPQTRQADLADLVPIELPGVDRAPVVATWQGRTFDPRVAATFRVCPTSKMEGFFVAQFEKALAC